MKLPSRGLATCPHMQRPSESCYEHFIPCMAKSLLKELLLVSSLPSVFLDILIIGIIVRMILPGPLIFRYKSLRLKILLAHLEGHVPYGHHESCHVKESCDTCLAVR